MKNVKYSIPAIVIDCETRSQAGIIQPLGRKGVPIIALSHKQKCPAFHSKYVCESFISPSLNYGEKEYIEFLVKLPKKGVLIYSNDLAAVVISKYQEKLRDAGFLVNISENKNLERAFDKWECYKIARKLDVPIAKTKIVKSLNEVYEIWDDFEKPVLLKGTRMAGGDYPKIISKKQIQGAWEKISNEVKSSVFKARESEIILQEWQSYSMTDNWSCETVFNKRSKPHGFFTIQRIRTSLNIDGTYSSRLSAGYYEYNRKLINMTNKILNFMEWKGFAHVEYFYVPKKKKFFLTEVNPRLPGYAYYPCSSGFNMAYFYYKELIGENVLVPKSFSKSLYFEAFSYPGDISEAFIHIPKGNINFYDFVKSYMALLKPRYIKIIYPIRLDDPAFTLRILAEYASVFLKRVKGYIIKKFIKLKGSSNN